MQKEELGGLYLEWEEDSEFAFDNKPLSRYTVWHETNKQTKNPTKTKQ